MHKEIKTSLYMEQHSRDYIMILHITSHAVYMTLLANLILGMIMIASVTHGTECNVVLTCHHLINKHLCAHSMKK
jgi:hypothetical protein